MTIMVYVYFPLTVVKSHHFLPSCNQIGVTLNDVTSFPAKKAYANLNATWQEVMRRYHCQWKVNIYHNSHHGCYLAVKIVSNILKKAQGRKFEKE